MWRVWIQIVLLGLVWYWPVQGFGLQAGSKLLTSAVRRAALTPVFATSPKEGGIEEIVGIPSRGLVDYIGRLPLQSPSAVSAVAAEDKEASEEKKEGSTVAEVTLDQVMAKTFYDLFQSDKVFQYRPPTPVESLMTSFKLWLQYPWLKLPERRMVVKAKLGGSLPLESPMQSIFAMRDDSKTLSLKDTMQLFLYAAHDPRIVGIYLELDGLDVGYAKLNELLRVMKYYQESGKKVVCYMTSASEKEYYLASQCDEIFMPPDGDLDLRGFSSSPEFYRGVFDKVGIEPQVQRIGKYKSFGDAYNRTDMSAEQREVVSSLLTESAENWIKHVAASRNQSIAAIRKLFVEDSNRTPYEFKEKGLLTGVLYADQVDALLSQDRFAVPSKPSLLDSLLNNVSNLGQKLLKIVSKSQPSDNTRQQLPLGVDYDLQKDFELQPRRRLNAIWQEPNMDKNTNTNTSTEAVETQQATSTNQTAIAFDSIAQNNQTQAVVAGNGVQNQTMHFIGANRYVSKLRHGSAAFPALPIREMQSGKRIAIIQAEGGIYEGESKPGNTGADTVIAQLRRARLDPHITAVVLRIDSPGGSPLASDLVWRELRACSQVKPVVASMVDVAASGGYYFSMGCDEIVADDMTITGSIGLVMAKFNFAELFKRVGFNVETVSIGKHAELLSVSKSFTADEAQCFETSAQQGYRSFVTKAAASRSMEVEDMEEVAQGRVWTGRQARERKLVDYEGGLFKALAVAEFMSQMNNIKELQETYLANHTIQNTTKVFSVPLTLKDFRVEYLKPTGNALLRSLSASTGARSAKVRSETPILALASGEVFSSGLVGQASFGTQGILHDLGVNAQSILMLESLGVLQGLEKVASLLQVKKDTVIWLSALFQLFTQNR